MMNTPKWVILGKGTSGWHAGAPNVSSSGYDTGPEPPAHYLAHAIEGALVYDASRADPHTFVRWVLNGPMVDERLTGTESDAFTNDDRAAAARMLPGLGMEYARMVKREALQKKEFGYGHLDKVSPETYCALLRRHVSGVRFGRVTKGAVAWEGPSQ